MDNKDILEIINNESTLIELSTDPERFGEDLIDQCFMNQFIMLKINNIDLVIDFNLFIGVILSNSMGDNYVTENFNEIESMKIDVDIVNIDIINEKSTIILNRELKTNLEKLVLKFLI